MAKFDTIVSMIRGRKPPTGSEKAKRNHPGPASVSLTGIQGWTNFAVGTVVKLPQYLLLFAHLLADNRVSSKAKVIIIAALLLIAAPYAGALGWVMSIAEFLLGPVAYVPVIVVILIALDMVYGIVDFEVRDEYEKEIFGDSGTIESDIRDLGKWLGPRYDSAKNYVEALLQKVRDRLQRDGRISEGDEITDPSVVQEAVDLATDLSCNQAQDIVAEVQSLTAEEQTRLMEEGLRSFNEKLPE